MRLTLMTDLSLRLLMYLAAQPGRLCTIGEIADAHAVSEAHLMKVTHLLGRLGFIGTVRGKGGGMRLAMAPELIGIGHVVRSLETDLALVECFGPDGGCRLTGQCRLTGVLRGALDGFLAHLDRHTLADLVAPTPADGRRRGRGVAVMYRSRR